MWCCSASVPPESSSKLSRSNLFSSIPYGAISLSARCLTRNYATSKCVLGLPIFAARHGKRARAAKHFYCPLFHIFQLWFEAHKLRVMRPRSSTMFFHQFWLFSARDDIGVRASDFIFGREHLSLTHIYYHKSALENRQTQLLSYGSTCDSWTWTKGSTIDRTNCTAGFHL